MGFEVAPEAYDQFMGRYSRPLAERLVERLAVRPGMRALDVGCGPGVLTAQLVQRLGTGSVAAVDPSTTFVAATRSRFPGVQVLAGFAESLPFADDTFDVTVARSSSTS